jgi:hypothetical protein
VPGADVVAAENGVPAAGYPVHPVHPVCLHSHHIHADHKLLPSNQVQIIATSKTTEKTVPKA